jgi:hypothetical protein
VASYEWQGTSELVFQLPAPLFPRPTPLIKKPLSEGLFYGHPNDTLLLHLVIYHKSQTHAEGYTMHIRTTTDPITLHDVPDPDNHPCLYEGDGENGLGI